MFRSPRLVLREFRDDDFDAVVDVNLRGVFLCTRAVVPHMIRSGGGVILSASSVVGLHGNFGQTNYGAAKMGVVGMMNTLVQEGAKYNIRVNALCPGYIETANTRAYFDSFPDPEAERARVGGLHVVARIGSPDEVAGPALFLASAEASFITGATLDVNGGLLMR